MQEIQAYQASQVKPAPAPTIDGNLKSIFGINGKNTVKVDSQYTNYGYET